MLGIWAVRVVLLPSLRSHLPVIVPPTPVVEGVTTTSLGLLSLNGEPKKPQTTPAVCGGVKLGSLDAWMCAATRLSFTSADWAPGRSIPVTVALIVMEGCAALSTNVAVPDELRGTPALVVGLTLTS